MDILNDFISGVRTDVTDGVFAEAVVRAAQVLFEGSESTVVSVDVSNLDGETAKELAAKMTELGEKREAAGDADKQADETATEVAELANAAGAANAGENKEESA